MTAKKKLGSLAKRPVSGKKAAAVKGGSKIAANAHEMKKALISNFPR